MELEFDGPSGPLGIALALLLGLGAIGYGGYSYTAQTSALNAAEPVDATVVSTSVETVDQRRGVAYRPRATFNYTYEGETYTSSNVYPGPLPREFGSEADARAQLRGYEAGATVTAHVPSDAPGNAFLEVERSDKPFLVIGFGALVVAGTTLSALRG